MVTHVLDKERPPPKPIRPIIWWAVALETAIVVTFFSKASIMGLMLCFLYARFTATWAMLAGHLND